MKLDSNDRPAWITGADGLIGGALVNSAPHHAPSRTVVALTRQLIDLTDYSKVRLLFQEQKPSLVIHCAALSRSPECEQNPAHARLTNVDVTRHLAKLCGDIPLIFLSSDLVFDGLKGDYGETDPVNPLSVYAETKAEAETIVLENSMHTVVRTSLNGGTSPKGNRGFNEELRRAWLEGRTTKLFTDEFRSPIPAVITARAIWELVQQRAPGMYHLAGAEKLSRWEIGRLVASRWPRLRPRIEPSSISEYDGAARPPDSSLNSAKIQTLISFELPGLTDWLLANPNIEF